MFSGGSRFLVHPETVPCGSASGSSREISEPPAEEPVRASLKQFHWGKSAKPLLQELENSSLIESNRIKSTAFFAVDVLKFLTTRDPPGNNGQKSNKKMLPVLRYLQSEGFTVPECYIKSNFAKNYLCGKVRKSKENA